MLEAIFIIVMIVLFVLAVVFFWLPFGWIVILACALGSDDPNLGACDMTHTAVVIYGATALILAVVNSRSIVAWLHYLFVPHPAAQVVKRSRGEASDHKKLATTIEASHLSTIEKPPKPFVSRNMKRKADELAALTERYAAEGELLSTHEEFVRKQHRRKQLKEER